MLHTRHQHQVTRQRSLSQNTDTSRVGQKLPSHNLDTGLHRRITATETVTQLGTIPKKVVLLTDSLSILQSLASGNPEDYTLRNVIQRLNSLTSRTTAVLQWVPAHTGIHGNEVADQLAKEGSKKQQPKSKHDEDILNVQCMWTLNGLCPCETCILWIVPVFQWNNIRPWLVHALTVSWSLWSSPHICCFAACNS